MVLCRKHQKFGSYREETLFSVEKMGDREETLFSVEKMGDREEILFSVQKMGDREETLFSVESTRSLAVIEKRHCSLLKGWAKFM